jgi:hypothetical protein
MGCIRQRLISAKCGKDWRKVIQELRTQGMTLAQVADHLSANVLPPDRPVAGNTLSHWLKAKSSTADDPAG